MAARKIPKVGFPVQGSGFEGRVDHRSHGQDNAREARFE